MALTKVSGPLLNSGNHNLGNYVINNITGAAATFSSLDCSNIDLSTDDLKVVGIITNTVLTPERVVWVGTGNTLTESDNLTWDNTNVRLKNLGITSTKSLNVTGISTFHGDIALEAAGANRISMRHTSGGNAVIKNPTAANLSFGTNDQDNELTIKNGGNIGIGTATPADLVTIGAGGTTLTIQADGKIGIGEDDPDDNNLLIRAASTVGTKNGHIMLTGDSATNGQGPQIVFSESGSGSSYAGAYIGHVRTTTNSVGDLVFGTRATGGDANTIPTENLRINSGGQLILGSNPTVLADAALHIELNGTREYLRLEGDAGTSNAYLEIEAPDNRRKAIIFKSGGTRRGIIGVGDSDEAVDATSLFFSASDKIAGNDPHMVIKSDGNIGINETSPDQILHITDNTHPYIRTTLNDTTVTANNVFGAWEFESIDSSTGCSGVIAKIDCISNATFDGTAANGSDIRFLTSGTNPISLTEKLRITSGGDTTINTGNVGVHTATLIDNRLVGPASGISSFRGAYLADGMMVFNNTLNNSEGYYIGAGLNALNAGPVTLLTEMTIDGTWVIV